MEMQCPGFRAAGVAAGIKKKDELDLGLIYSEQPAQAAGVFTRNRIPAAPVQYDRRQLRGGSARAVIVNSGNANCCTGAQGLEDAAQMARLTAKSLTVSEDQVLVASTGVIGEPLPINKIAAAVPELVQRATTTGFSDLARAIMTTDTYPKLARRRFEIDGRAVTIVGVAKGSGMIHPDMATMLCFVCTDLSAPADHLQSLLSEAVAETLNRLVIDGDTSTNDTALLLANGVSGATVESPAGRAQFAANLKTVLLDLTRMLAKDGEGATKLVEVDVQGASSVADARAVAETVATSPLVKTAMFGEDANWGRLMMAIGRAGVELDPEKITISFGDVLMVENGRGLGAEAEAAAADVLRAETYRMTIDLNLGNQAYNVFTCDYSVDYIRINADYRT